MKVYEGHRTIDGISVTVDGVPLDARVDLEQFTDRGFEWTYEGEAPRQLALALIADCLDDIQARELSAPFMAKVVSDLDNEWQLTEDDIRREIEFITENA